MTGNGGHLTIERALHVLHTRACPEAETDEHLGQCEPCRQMVHDYERLMSRLYEFGKPGQPKGECPAPGTWGELAAGVKSEQEASQLLNHAPSCKACVEELLHALEAVGSNEPAPQELQQTLMTATADWQKRFAANVAATHKAGQPRSKPWTGWRWAPLAVTALLVLTVAAGLYLLRGGSPDALIQQAYAQQRTLEMRIPGARYGRLQVQRADGRSQLSSPQALLDAQARVKRGMEKKADNPDLLRQKAEIDLLNGQYQAALETLNHAARLKFNSFALLVDTASAYFERAEATANLADYEAGLQSLGDALRIKPNDPAALFNRALLYERLYVYGRAAADWEEFLKVEQDPGWRKEAEQHLREIRQREQHRTLWRDPEQLTLAQFTNAVADPALAAIEEYVQAAERRIVPRITAPQGQEYQAVTALAAVLQSRHSDRFLKDLPAAAASPQFRQAAQALAQSSSANGRGRYAQAYSAALQAAALFGRMGDTAGVLAAQFEESYALQLEFRARPCQALAAQAAAAAHRQGYVLLAIQLLLEQSICSNMNGDLGQAKELDRRASALAQAHDYPVLYLRGLALRVTLECNAGDESSAWAALRDGLRSFWDSTLPPLRAYSLYSALDDIAGRAGHLYVRFAALSEALSFRNGNSSRMVEASARAQLSSARPGEELVYEVAPTPSNQSTSKRVYRPTLSDFQEPERSAPGRSQEQKFRAATLSCALPQGITEEQLRRHSWFDQRGRHQSNDQHCTVYLNGFGYHVYVEDWQADPWVITGVTCGKSN